MIDLKIYLEYDYVESFRPALHEKCLVRLIKFNNRLYWKFLSKVEYVNKDQVSMYQTIKIPWKIDDKFWLQQDIHGFITPFEEKHFEWIVD